MKIAILGASRGLGRELSLLLQAEQPNSSLLLISRKFDLLRQIARGQDLAVSADFSTDQGVKSTLTELEKFKPEYIYYVAGGGPYGNFGDKNWSDHLWANRVTYLTPAEILYWATSKKPASLKQIIFVGSSIAENAADPGAASYAAAKHALRGLVTSVQKEGTPFALKLFSPGYMATDMLPVNSAPRLSGEDPKAVARYLIQSSGYSAPNFTNLVEE